MNRWVALQRVGSTWWQRFRELPAMHALWPATFDPSVKLFRDIQWRLLAWYTGVLATILLFAGVVLSLGMQHQLFDPVNNYVQTSAQDLSQEWQQTHIPPCLEHRPFATPYVACYDANGALLSANRLAIEAPGFLTANLASTALTQSHATDSVDAGNGLAMVQRYSLVVRDSTGQVLGVAQVGLAIEGQVQAMTTLRNLLFLVGALTLVGASGGGLFLARRALAPARMAYARQQSFIADASHELRTPLTLLRADADVLLRSRDRLSADDIELVEDIVSESTRLATLTTNLLTLARLDTGTTALKHDLVDLGELATTVADRITAFAAEKDVTIQVSEAAPVLTLGDPQLLEQAILILVDNAIKYNVPSGTVTVLVTQQGQNACVSVQDSGVGIAPEHLMHLGERFYRPDVARARVTGGTGLGISIAFGIAHAHQGTLSFVSDPGVGTTVTLTLPLAQIPSEE